MRRIDSSKGIALAHVCLRGHWDRTERIRCEAADEMQAEGTENAAFMTALDNETRI